MQTLIPDELKLLAYMDDHQNELIELLQNLIQFDTQNFITAGRESKCQAFIQTWFQKHGFKTERYSPESVPGLTEHPAFNPNRGTDVRENVTAFFSAESGQKKPIMIAAHTDTMPVGDLNAWKYNPFGGIVDRGRIYGLGAGDNKAGLAAGMMSFKALHELGLSVQQPILMTAYVDEEYGGGGGALASCLRYPSDSYLNLDGGNYELWLSALGGGGFKIEIVNDNSTDTASTLMPALVQVHDALLSWGKALRARLHDDPLYQDTDMERSVIRIMEVRIGESGVALNHAYITFVIYTKEEEQTLRRELDHYLKPVRQHLLEIGIRILNPVNTTRFFEYGIINLDSRMLNVLEKSIFDASSRHAPRRGACLSDLSIFQRYGSSDSLSFGILRDFALPGGAHQPDEFVEIRELFDYWKSLTLFLYRYTIRQ